MNGRFKYRESCPTPVSPYRIEKGRTTEDIKKEVFGMEKAVMNTVIISRVPRTIPINVGTVPVQILQPPHVFPYLLSNPSLSVGVTNTVKLVDDQLKNAAGNTQANPLGVAGYTNLHLFLNVTGITGGSSWDFTQQALVPTILPNTWVDVQNVFAGINAAGVYYASVGSLGVVTDAAFSWNPTIAGTITFSLIAVTKEGSLQTSGGLSKTIFLGGRDVTVENGLPLFEGDNKIFYLGPEVELFAVSSVATILKVFIL